jgi:hypothetical protein
MVRKRTACGPKRAKKRSSKANRSATVLLPRRGNRVQTSG